MTRHKLRQLATAATQGEWSAEDGAPELGPSGAVIGVFIRHRTRGGRIGQVFSNCLVSEKKAIANARFIAAASPSRILRLINQLDKANAELRAMKAEGERA